MITTDVVVVGGGPAGLCAAIEAAEAGARVLLIERSDKPGGQLIKQTHKFFGSKKQYAAMRGIDIATLLLEKITHPNITLWTDATVLGIYEDNVITVEHQNTYKKISPKAIIAATGASENFLPFENNDLPGIYGAGAVQTLMNLYGVVPAKRVVMIGAGNIGLIVSYQLMQAGVDVLAVMCTGPKFGGYCVHASKIRRMGVPIMTGTTVLRANGKEHLESVTLVKVDEKRKPIPGTEFDIECDNLCISVGLSPLSELLWQMGCKMKHSAALGGFVPLRNKNLQTSLPNVFVAGDVAGVEEASAAMVEGRIAGLSAAAYIGVKPADYENRMADYQAQIESLRSGAHAAKIRSGIDQVQLA